MVKEASEHYSVSEAPGKPRESVKRPQTPQPLNREDHAVLGHSKPRIAQLRPLARGVHERSRGRGDRKGPLA